MDRKNKVWLIVLIALLLAAIAAVLGINGKYSGAKEALEAASTQLLQSQESSAAFETQLTEVQAQVTEMVAQLADAEAIKAGYETQISEMETQLADAQAVNAEYEAKLTDAEAKLTDAEAQLTVAEAQIAAAEVQLNELGVQLVDAQTAAEIYSQEKQAAQNTISTMEAVAAEYQAHIAQLQTAITAAEGQIAQLIANSAAVVETEAVETEAEVAESAEISEIAAEEAEIEVGEVAAEEVSSDEVSSDEVSAEADVVENVEGIFESEATVDVNEIYEDIYAIINDESGEMSDAEKVAALDELKVQLSLYVEELNVALDEISKQEAALAESVDSIELLEAELVTAQANVDALNSAIAASQATIADLTAQVEELNALNETNSAEAQAQIDALMAQIAAEQEKVAALAEELAAANAELAARLAELEVYKLERELGAGEAYTASTMADVLKVAADGKTVEWTYTNDTISGNAVVLSIQIEGEAIFTSALLQPGETLQAVELETALDAGEYAAIAVESVSDASGAVVSVTRWPVAIVVG